MQLVEKHDGNWQKISKIMRRSVGALKTRYSSLQKVKNEENSASPLQEIHRLVNKGSKCHWSSSN